MRLSRHLTDDLEPIGVVFKRLNHFSGCVCLVTRRRLARDSILYHPRPIIVVWGTGVAAAFRRLDEGGVAYDIRLMIDRNKQLTCCTDAGRHSSTTLEFTDWAYRHVSAKTAM